MEPAKFEDYKVPITDAIQEKLKQTPITGENGFTLIEGFIMETLKKDLSTNIVLGGPTTFIPLVAVVGKTTGRVYYFAVKTLGIPGLTI